MGQAAGWQDPSRLWLLILLLGSLKTTDLVELVSFGSLARLHPPQDWAGWTFPTSMMFIILLNPTSKKWMVTPKWIVSFWVRWDFQVDHSCQEPTWQRRHLQLRRRCHRPPLMLRHLAVRHGNGPVGGWVAENLKWMMGRWDDGMMGWWDMYYIWMHYSSPLSWNICIRPMKKEFLTEGELSVATVWGIKQWSLPY